MPLSVWDDREPADLGHLRVVPSGASSHSGDQPAAAVPQTQREHVRIGELGGYLGGGLPQRRKVHFVVRLGLRDVRGALQGQHFPGVLGAEPGQQLHLKQRARHDRRARRSHRLLHPVHAQQQPQPRSSPQCDLPTLGRHPGLPMNC